ncbi:MAG: class I SAM-dependent methyltransferase [Francisellaceae bacterium]
MMLSEEEKSLTQALQQKIEAKIEDRGGQISFQKYMQMALYDGQFGYYMNGREKLGAQGDFITAPMVCPLFSQTFAAVFAEILPQLGDEAVIIEFGAGNGDFARDCLSYLDSLNRLPRHYYIIELSPFLRRKQQVLLKTELPHLYHRLIWLDKLPENRLDAIVFANEVLDAMPVELFGYQQGKFISYGVSKNKDEFALVAMPELSQPLKNALQHLQQDGVEFRENYVSEVNLWLEPWLSSLKASLNSAVVFLADYGYQRRLYYSSERSMGTLRGYFRHQTVDDVLINPGLYDITAHVDFTAVAEAADNSGFELEGYAPQGAFLMEAGIDQLYTDQCQKIADPQQKIELTQALKKLTLDPQFAEMFKVMTLSWHFEGELALYEKVELSYLL